MPAGPRRHLKRLNAPKSWRLDKLGGKYAPKPSSGPYKNTECMPLCLILSRKLKVASSSKQIDFIVDSKMVKINGVIRTDRYFPVGIFDVLELKGEYYRIFYDITRAFIIHPISSEESNFKLVRVMKKVVGKNQVPYIYCSDGHTFNWCDPAILVDHSIKVDSITRRPVEYFEFKIGNTAFITKGKNLGSIGVIRKIERHEATDDIAHLEDANGRMFSTLVKNAFVVGKDGNCVMSLPKGDGLKISELEKSDTRFGGSAKVAVASLEVE